MSEFVCRSAAELVSALGSAKSGDTIFLESGNYSNVQLKGFSFEGMVTITSKDPANPAIFTGLSVNNSQGLSFNNLQMDFTSPWTTWNAQVNGSKNIELNNISLHGSLNGSPADDQSGILVRSSVNVKITGSEFQQLDHGISMVDSSGVSVASNRFHDMRADGIVSAGTSNVQIVGNHFTNFYPVTGDHPDAIQFLTRGTTASARDILISGNFITRGEGAIIQGIFLTDQVGTLPYQNVTITNNVVVGAMYNGIAVAHSANLTLTGNTVAAYSDMKSYIQVFDTETAVVANNEAMRINLSNITGLTQTENVLISSLKGDATNALSHWVWGSAGADQLFARESGSRIEAGAGDDIVTGRDGADYLRGGDGRDLINAGGGDDDVNGNMGEDTVNGGWGDDILSGGKDSDVLFGEAGADMVFGNMGNDIVEGGDGADTLRGGQHEDVLRGGDGADWLSGDLGSDTIFGGSGADTFHAWSASGLDVIADFNLAEGDRVLITGGATYQVAQHGADVVIDISGGAQVVLSNTSLSSLGDGWIVSG